MEKIAGVIKCMGCLIVVGSTLSFAVLNLFNDSGLFIPSLITVIYVALVAYYLIITSMWNFKDMTYRAKPLVIAGISLHFLAVLGGLVFFLIPADALSETRPPAMMFLPMLLAGLLVGIFDVIKIIKARKYNGRMQASGSPVSLAGNSNLSIGNKPANDQTIAANEQTTVEVLATIKTRMEKSAYIKLIFGLTYRNPWAIVVAMIGALMVAGGIFSNGHKLFDLNDASLLLRWLFGVAMLVFVPISVYRSAIKAYNNNQRLQESIVYEISTEGLHMTGESFHLHMRWQQSDKVVMQRRWLLIYQSAQIAHPIPIRDLTKETLDKLRRFFHSQGLMN